MVLSGCASTWKAAPPPPPRTESIVVEHESDGAHGPMVVHGEAWYQACGRVLLVLDDHGEEMGRLPLAEAGTSRPIMDMALTGDTLAVLLGDREVVMIDVSSPWRPVEDDRIEGTDIGMWPTTLATLDGDVVAIGPGGVRSLEGRHLLRSDEADVSDIVSHRGRVLYVSGRRIHRRAGGAYVGTASDLELAPPHPAIPEGAFLFARQERTGTLVGILGEDCRELDPSTWTTSVAGRIRGMRPRGGQVLVVGEDGLSVLRMTHEGLIHEWAWTCPDIEDATWLGDGRIAVSGGFGRAVIHVGDHAVTHWHEAPGGLKEAASTGDHLVARSAHGVWAYQPGKAPTKVDGVAGPMTAPDQKAAVLGWSVSIDEVGTATVTAPGGVEHLEAPAGGRFRCVTATEDAFWLGHDRGILLLILESPEDEPMKARRLGVMVDGPVRCIEPLLLGGGVAFAAEGGFGVVREVW